MNKTTALRLSDKEFEKLEMLKKAYDINNTSELLRMLIRKDYTNLTSYEGLRNLSDKQIIKVGLLNNSITQTKGGKINEQTPQSSRSRRKSIS